MPEPVFYHQNPQLLDLPELTVKDRGYLSHQWKVATVLVLPRNYDDRWGPEAHVDC